MRIENWHNGAVSSRNRSKSVVEARQSCSRSVTVYWRVSDQRSECGGSLLGRVGPDQPDLRPGPAHARPLLPHHPGLPGPHREGLAPLRSQVHGQVRLPGRGQQGDITRVHTVYRCNLADYVPVSTGAETLKPFKFVSLNLLFSRHFSLIPSTW